MSIEVPRKEVDKAIYGLNASAMQMHKDIRSVVNRSTLAIHRKAKYKAQEVANDEGRLNASIRPKFAAPGKLTGEVIVGVHYAPYIEFGTKSRVSVPAELKSYAEQFRGKGRGSFAEFKENMQGWLKRHNIPQEALYPIMAKILKNGSKARPFLFPAMKDEEPRFQARMRAVTRKYTAK